ncbi:MAG: ergothioneine biosynthesis protein EgtB, partial [Bacteroidota bacterium]|nr:ergothioneine biosynthesis protein EgtB [Bacteroidota bacterium]MDX5430819.1 ergothioneine biosynthesis protein EgtB [Bacteroidota bacterium]MDX5469565.1 ergothioneine biosynthesis protein EgtB [Bacteroidota bacterium]
MSLLEEFLKCRAWTERLVEPLEREDQVVQPILEVSPPKWHLAHTTWFFETFVLQPYVKDYQVFHPEFSFLFNSYYHQVGDRVSRDSRGFMTRPTVKEIMHYRRHVSEALGIFWEFLEKHPQFSEIRERMILGINHEQQHQELLLTDIKYILGTQYLQPEYVIKDAPDTGWFAEKDLEWNSVEEGTYTIGHEGEGFCFDNEKQAHEVFLRGFEIADRAIVNREYIDFIESEAYQDSSFWLSDGWEWLQQTQNSAPLYWKKRDGVWWRYSMGGLIQVEDFGPLMHVNYYEADAFARWMNARLPTEAEWEAAFQVNPDWMYSPVWEWCATAYLPFPGFKIQEGALGEYNGKFMVNQMVLKG